VSTEYLQFVHIAGQYRPSRILSPRFVVALSKLIPGPLLMLDYVLGPCRSRVERTPTGRVLLGGHPPQDGPQLSEREIGLSRRQEVISHEPRLWLRIDEPLAWRTVMPRAHIAAGVSHTFLLTESGGIAYSTMDTRKLAKLKGELKSKRRSPQKAKDLESFAKKLGRELMGKRGKEPVWVSREFLLPPVSIPHHGGRDMAIGTKNAILDQLEEDILEWEQRLSGDDDDAG